MDILELQHQIDTLRAELASTEAALPAVEAELVPANAVLEAAQLTFDEVGRARATTMAASGETWQPAVEGQTWRPRSAGEAEKARDDAREIAEAWTVARQDLEAAL